MNIESIPISEVKEHVRQGRPSIYEDVFEAIKNAQEAIKVTLETNQKARGAGFAIRSRMKRFPDFRKCKVSYNGNILYVIPLDLLDEEPTDETS